MRKATVSREIDKQMSKSKNNRTTLQYEITTKIMTNLGNMKIK